MEPAVADQPFEHLEQSGAYSLAGKFRRHIQALQYVAANGPPSGDDAAPLGNPYFQLTQLSFHSGEREPLSPGLRFGGRNRWRRKQLPDDLRAQSARNGENPVTQGLLRGIEDGWFMAEIAEAAFAYQIALEKGEKKVVGVNCHRESVTSELEILRVSHEVETEQVRILDERRSGRDKAAVDAAIAEMLSAAREDRNMIPSMLDACRAEATLGEICDALRQEWGEYREPARF